VVTMVQVSHFRLTWALSALATDDVTCAIAHITTQVITRIGGSATIIKLVRTDNLTAR